MLEIATATEFLRAPIGRCVRGPTYLVWCIDGGLCGAVYWGRPSESDARAVVQLFAIDEHPAMRAPFDVLTDARLVRTVDGAAFGVLARHLRRKSADYATRIRRNAIVHPDGLLGATIAGLYSIVTPSHAWRPFVDAVEALRWLGRADVDAIASELGRLTPDPEAREDVERGPRAHPPSRGRAERRIGSSLCGKYRLTRVLGIGGMGAVYAGEHRNGHPVAVKVLHERLADRPDLELGFRREAQLANRVKHPAIVPVLDDDVTEDGCVFLVMPLLVGETVRARWERERLRDGPPIEDVATIGLGMLGALGAAHRARIVHRDVKPENVFLTREGEVRLLDFGIARLLETTDPVSATLTGHAVGTPAFMAPEQALGHVRAIDARTDLWAVGAVMYALATGQLVHEGATPSEILVSAATRPARPVRGLALRVPIGLARVIDRALAFDKRDRWPSAEAMEGALVEALARDLGTSPGRLPRIEVPSEPPDAAPEPAGSLAAPSEELASSSEPTEEIRAVVTRTMPPAPSGRARPAGRRRWIVALALVALAAALGGLLAILAR